MSDSGETPRSDLSRPLDGVPEEVIDEIYAYMAEVPSEQGKENCSGVPDRQVVIHHAPLGQAGISRLELGDNTRGFVQRSAIETDQGLVRVRRVRWLQ